MFLVLVPPPLFLSFLCSLSPQYSLPPFYHLLFLYLSTCSPSPSSFFPLVLMLSLFHFIRSFTLPIICSSLPFYLQSSSLFSSFFSQFHFSYTFFTLSTIHSSTALLFPVFHHPPFFTLSLHVLADANTALLIYLPWTTRARVRPSQTSPWWAHRRRSSRRPRHGTTWKQGGRKLVTL